MADDPLVAYLTALYTQRRAALLDTLQRTGAVAVLYHSDPLTDGYVCCDPDGTIRYVPAAEHTARYTRALRALLVGYVAQYCAHTQGGLHNLR